MWLEKSELFDPKINVTVWYYSKQRLPDCRLALLFVRWIYSYQSIYFQEKKSHHVISHSLLVHVASDIFEMFKITSMKQKLCFDRSCLHYLSIGRSLVTADSMKYISHSWRIMCIPKYTIENTSGSFEWWLYIYYIQSCF